MAIILWPMGTLPSFFFLKLLSYSVDAFAFHTGVGSQAEPDDSSKRME